MSTTIDDSAVQKLNTEFSGELLRAGDDGYDEARTIFNAMFDRRPAVIARCRTTADVAAAVNFGRGTGLALAVKGGGHSIAGFSSCDGGLLIDLSLMKHIDVDPARRVATAEPGVILRELDAATQAHGLATPLGYVSPTGIGGLTLNGGLGFLSRKHGLTCDNLLAAEVVLADGSIVDASDDENADLIWGLRGGGGNFGIVTRFEYRLHPVTEVYGRMQYFAIEDLAPVLRHFAASVPALPDDVTAFVGTLVVPENPMFPEALHGKLTVFLMGGYIGGEADGAPALSALTTPVTPTAEMAMTLPYQMAQMVQDEEGAPGFHHYWKSGSLDDITEGLIDVVCQWAPTAPSPLTTVGLLALGGAIARVQPDATAYRDRQSMFNLSIDSNWADPQQSEHQIAWTRSFFDAAKPHLNGGAYLNFTVDETGERIRQAYGANYERLVALKTKYDPANVFRLNQNIVPAGS